MRTLGVLAAALCLATHAQQHTPFIEVAVIDTAKAPTERIVYSCTVQPDLTGFFAEHPYGWNAASSPKEQKRLQEELRKHQDSACMDQSGLNDQLMARGYTRIQNAQPAAHFTVNPFPSGDCSTGYNTGVMVELGSEQELVQLVAWLRELGNVTGYIVTWETDKLSHDSAALQRMYNDAYAQASALAQLGGRTLGNLISAQETSNEPARQTGYDQAEGLVYYGYTGDVNPDRRSMTFKFTLKE